MDFLVYKRLKNDLNWTKGHTRIMHVIFLPRWIERQINRPPHVVVIRICRLISELVTATGVGKAYYRLLVA